MHCFGESGTRWRRAERGKCCLLHVVVNPPRPDVLRLCHTSAGHRAEGEKTGETLLLPLPWCSSGAFVCKNVFNGKGRGV